uniref:AsnC family transcriptional regulator n=1 Tax=Nocardia sp. XZ_19_385 TaxID=2769488 RepID=UPI002815AFB6|nr:AsnC family transcriptional regulator [Nocardia sp. XZ_19_385]
MQESYDLLTEDELALIHALQLRPRASWAELGHALGVDPVTVARRWQRLAGRGAAWVGVSPGPRLFDQVCLAYLRIDCVAGQVGSVVEELAKHPHLVTLERAAGPHHILATAGAADLAAMSRYTLDVLPALPHVTAVRADLITHMFTEGGDWRIDALDPEQRTRLAAPAAQPPSKRDRSRLTDQDRALLDALAHDGRASYSALAAQLGTGTAVVKRRLEELTRLGLFRFRCDFARPLGGWPVAVTFWATAPADHCGTSATLSSSSRRSATVPRSPARTTCSCRPVCTRSPMCCGSKPTSPQSILNSPSANAS